MENAGLHPQEPEEPVVEHLLEDFRVAEEGGGRVRVAVEADGVRVGLERGDPVGEGWMRGPTSDSGESAR